ncbi:hypothetical protein ACKC5Q_23135, partial [Aeromonas dhakensis]
LCVNGSGSKRAELVKQFYEIARGGEETRFSYPEIVPEVMASLSELLDQNFTISDVMLRLLNELKRNSDFLYAGQLNDYELELFPGYYQR